MLTQPKQCKSSHRLFNVPVREFATESEAIEYQREKEREMKEDEQYRYGA